MADAQKAKLRVDYSENADYSDPEFISNWDTYETTPDEYRNMTLEVDTSAVSLDFTDFATVTFFAVQNVGPTNFLTLTWTDSAANANTQKVPVNSLVVLGDIDPSTNPTLAADTLAVTAKIIISGS